MVGGCDVQDDCVSSKNYPNMYGNDESCSITILQDVSISVGSTFNLETCCDRLMIYDNRVKNAASVPTFMNSGTTFTWSTDGSVNFEGWQLCFTDASIIYITSRRGRPMAAVLPNYSVKIVFALFYVLFGKCWIKQSLALENIE